jgi:cell division septation protein DedD
VAVWIVLALMGSSSDDAGQEVAESGEELPPEPPPPTSLSFRIEPPPEVITNPEIPEEPPEPGPPEAGQAARAVGGVFAPEELESEWASRGAGLIRAGANEMVPLISRMEPVGRRLDPERPVPKAERIELKPPDPEAEPKPRRPRLSAPPAASRTAPAAPSPSPSRRRYTIIMGSFSKEANAERLRERLESEGLPAEVMSVTVNNQPWWRVMSGVFEDQAAAEAYGRELRRKNLVDRPYIMIM